MRARAACSLSSISSPEPEDSHWDSSAREVPASIAVESDPDCAATFRTNFPESILVESDIRTVAYDRRRRFDVVVAGPPCQGFSTLNRERNGDPRNLLYTEVLRCVDAQSPVLSSSRTSRSSSSRRRADARRGATRARLLGPFGNRERRGLRSSAAAYPSTGVGRGGRGRALAGRDPFGSWRESARAPHRGGRVRAPPDRTRRRQLASGRLRAPLLADRKAAIDPRGRLPTRPPSRPRTGLLEGRRRLQRRPGADSSGTVPRRPSARSSSGPRRGDSCIRRPTVRSRRARPRGCSPSPTRSCSPRTRRCTASGARSVTRCRRGWRRRSGAPSSNHSPPRRARHGGEGRALRPSPPDDHGSTVPPERDKFSSSTSQGREQAVVDDGRAAHDRSSSKRRRVGGPPHSPGRSRRGLACRRATSRSARAGDRSSATPWPSDLPGGRT